MGKVIFEYDEYDDKRDILLITNRDKLQAALEKVTELRGTIYNAKFYNNEMISVKDNKVLTNDDYKEADINGKEIMDTKDYVSREYLERELGNIIDSIVDFIYI